LAGADRCRRDVRVHGVVQGVGFRPFVYQLARRIGVTGSVRNDSAGVIIDAFGMDDDLDCFVRLLDYEPFFDMRPSWQNSIRSIERAAEPHVAIGDERAIVVVFPSNGDVPLLAVHPDARRQGLGRALIDLAARRAAKPLRIMNIADDAHGINAFLESVAACLTDACARPAPAALALTPIASAPAASMLAALRSFNLGTPFRSDSSADTSRGESSESAWHVPGTALAPCYGPSQRTCSAGGLRKTRPRGAALG